jgi:hypothetical protein
MKRRVLALALGIALAPIAARADNASCAKAAEDGQKARAAGSLRAAREKFLACGADTCPAVVRHDCAQWAAETLESIPTIIIDAKDQSGADVGDVTVKMDDAVLATKLDGKALAVDPGPHVFQFERAGSPPVSQSVIIKEAAKGRTFTVIFVKPGTRPPPAAEAPPPAPPPPPEDKPASRGVGPGPLVLALAGVAFGLTGAVIVAVSPKTPVNCDAATEKCVVPQDPKTGLPIAPPCAKTSSPNCYDLAADQDKAGTARTEPRIGYAVIATGALLLVSGVVWYLLARPSERASAVVPWISPGSAGIFGGASF